MWLKDPVINVKPGTIPLLRPKAGCQVKAALKGEPLRCYVHYCMGRSWPCTQHKCSLCKRAIAKRVYAYYPVSGCNGAKGILELTATAEHQLIQQMQEHTDIPSGMVVVSRKAGKRNNPCAVHYSKDIETEYSGGGTIDQGELQAALYRIWNLPSRNGEIDESEYVNTIAESIRLRTTKKASE